MREVDPQTGTMPNATAWLVFDQTYWEKFGIFGVTPGGEVPGLPPPCRHPGRARERHRRGRGGAARTVKRFNPKRTAGPRPGVPPRRDPVRPLLRRLLPPAGQATHPTRRFPAATAKAQAGCIAAAIGPMVSKLAGRVARSNDPERLRSVVVGPLAKIIRPVLKSPGPACWGRSRPRPYYALEVEASALGTVGGPRTDAHGRALDTDGQVIPGLYAAGNAGGAPTKGFYGGAGGTISLGLVFGYLAGREAAHDAARGVVPAGREPVDA